MKYYFTSDTHFGHAAVLRHSSRPFGDIDNHDESLIENWNSTVSRGDFVIHLGDLFWTGKERALSILGRLNGNICVIEGNHDATAKSMRGKFQWYDKTKTVVVNGQKIFLSHYAHRTWPCSHHGAWHLYGHSHGSLPELEGYKSIDVGVDAVARRLGGSLEDYRPIGFDEIEAIMATKRFVAQDHHIEEGQVEP